MGRLDGDVVLITGGGSGLGLGVARYIRGEGAKLAIVEIVPEKVAALKDYFGDDVLILQGDMRKSDDILAARDAIQRRFGKLNSLIGTQGITDGHVRLRKMPLDRLDAVFDELFHVNVRSFIASAKIFYDMLAEQEGTIVFTASSNAAYSADGAGVFYTATKHAVLGVVRQLAFEFAPKVRVNGVSPAGIGGSQLRGPGSLGLENESQNDIPKDKFMEIVKALTLTGYLPTADEYGPLYALLASRDSKTMTGETVIADQGVMNRAVLSTYR
jgi:NAD(P)-dependent dehydrogenase (short-subunit alcohol dehydrogenase family)